MRDVIVLLAALLVQVWNQARFREIAHARKVLICDPERVDGETGRLRGA